MGFECFFGKVLAVLVFWLGPKLVFYFSDFVVVGKMYNLGRNVVDGLMN